MVRRIVVWGLALAIAVGAAVAYRIYEPPLDVSVVKVSRGHVEETVAAISSGTVLAEADSMVASGWMGIIMEVPVKEGAEVSKGEALVVLDQTELDAQVRLAEANLRATQSQLEQAKLAGGIYADIAITKVSAAREQLKSAEAEHARSKELLSQGASSQSNLERTSLQLRMAQEDLDAALASQRENEVRKQEVEAAQSNVEQLEAALAVAEANRSKATIRAPFDGVVADIFMDVGEAINVGTPLLQLVRAETILVEAPFDEANAAEIHVGQKARINLDAYRDTDFEGEVVYIAPVVTRNPDLSRTLNVKIRITEGDEKFMAGMSADVTIIVEEKEDVLFAPSDAIIRDSFAYVAEGGVAVRRDVTTGIGNWSRREIVSGLAEGDMLVTSVSLTELEDGVRVRGIEEDGG